MPTQQSNISKELSLDINELDMINKIVSKSI